MHPSSSSYHFLVSCAAALAAAFIGGSLRGSAGPFQTATAAFLGTLALGELKEVHDLLRNPWSLSPAALRADCARDMLQNLAGGATGALLWALLWVNLAWIKSRRE